MMQPDAKRYASCHRRNLKRGGSNSAAGVEILQRTGEWELSRGRVGQRTSWECSRKHCVVLKKNQGPVIKAEWKLLQSGGHETHLRIKSAMLFQNVCVNTSAAWEGGLE